MSPSDPAPHRDDAPPPEVDRDGDVEAAPFVVYWRPGCGFCARLFTQLDRHDLDPVVRNIWDDDDARRFLNDHIGSETVPTVVVGDTVLVNPSVDEVLAALG